MVECGVDITRVKYELQMRAELKSFWSPDVEDLEKYKPADPLEIGFLLQLLIGSQDSIGEESFDVMVCTPRWLESTHVKHDIVVGRHYIIVFEYDFKHLLQFLKEQISKLHGENWQELAQKLARVGHWEFEDYQVSPD